MPATRIQYLQSAFDNYWERSSTSVKSSLALFSCTFLLKIEGSILSLFWFLRVPSSNSISPADRLIVTQQVSMIWTFSCSVEANRARVKSIALIWGFFTHRYTRFIYSFDVMPDDDLILEESRAVYFTVQRDVISVKTMCEMGSNETNAQWKFVKERIISSRSQRRLCCTALFNHWKVKKRFEQYTRILHKVMMNIGTLKHIKIENKWWSAHKECAQAQ